MSVHTLDTCQVLACFPSWYAVLRSRYVSLMIFALCMFPSLIFALYATLLLTMLCHISPPVTRWALVDVCPQSTVPSSQRISHDHSHSNSSAGLGEIALTHTSMIAY
eukprot:31414-Amorphochlora_amoeboformis.AAC.1